MPAPAISTVSVPGLWSRPTPPCEIGMRPNSAPQITSVESSSPRALQVGEQPGDRLVGLGGVLGVVAAQVAVRVPGVHVLVADAA